MRFRYFGSWFKYHVELVVTHHADDASAIGLVPDAGHCFDWATDAREGTPILVVTFSPDFANSYYWYPGAFALANGDGISFVEQGYAGISRVLSRLPDTCCIRYFTIV